MLRFNDGMSFNTQGEYRITRRSDGLYVVGHGQLIPINDYEEGRQIIAEEQARAAKNKA